MAANPEVASAEAFTSVLAKSGLLPAEALAKVRESAAAKTDAKALARELIKEGTLTRWQAAQLLHGYYLLGVGKYKLLDQLSSSETGRVYLAEHAQMGRRHAIKILARRQTSKPEVLKRFLDEAQRLCALDHRNLSHIYDVNQDGEKYYLVMEYVEGQDLGKLVEASGRLPLAQAVDYAAQAVEGLAHAHDKQVVHGDLKPANLIVDASRTLKITDVGQGRLIAPPAAAESDETTETAALSAAIYRAPELRSGGAAAETASDVYSLGNVLCYLLTGKPAADAADAQRLLLSVEEVPAELASLCGRMLADNPADRPALADVRSGLADALRLPARGAATPEKTDKSEMASQPKAKKQPVARAIERDDDEAVIVSVAPDNEAGAVESNPLAGFAGLNFQAQPRTRANAPAAKPAAKSAAKPSSESVEPASDASESDRPAAKKKSSMPLVIAAAVGGGVLVLAGLLVAVVVILNRGGGETKKQVAATKTAAPAAKPATDQAAVDAMVAAALGETNPTVPAEANPDPSAVAAATAGTARSEPAPPPAAAPPASATPASTTEPATPAGPMPVAEPTKPPTEPAKPAAEPAKPMPEAKPQPPKATPEPLKTTPPPPTKPAPPPPKPDLFKGLPAAIDIIKFATEMTDPPTPQVIGACPPDASAQLKGGDGAIRGGKVKFELVEGNDAGTLGSWQFVMHTGTPLTIATLGIENGQLIFQWTPDGAKHESAPYLGNCKLVLAAAGDEHELALRQPIVGESLLVDFDKAGAKAKWTVDYLPDPRKIVIEVSRLGDAFPTHDFDGPPQMEGSGAEMLVWTGADEKSRFLGIKFESLIAQKFVQVSAAGQLKAGDKAEPLVKRKLQELEKGIDSQRAQLIQQEKLLSNAKVEGEQKKQRDAALKSVKEAQEAIGVREDQLKQLQQLIQDLKDKSEVFFRVYYQADDVQVDLVTTDSAPPEKKEEKKAGDKKENAKAAPKKK